MSAIAEKNISRAPLDILVLAGINDLRFWPLGGLDDWRYLKQFSIRAPANLVCQMNGGQNT